MTGFEAWAVRAIAAGGLVLLAGWALTRLARGAGRRQVVAAWAVRGAVLAAVAAAGPAWLTVPLPAAEPPPVLVEQEQPTSSLVWEWDEGPVGAEVPVAETDPAPPPSEQVPPPWPAGRWLATGYAAVAGLLLVRLLAGHWALARLARRASPAPPRVTNHLPGRVLVADRVRTPVCFGLLRPTVLLPRGLAETASATELEWVLRHEADHVRRGDHRSNWWAAAAGCVFFPLPWYWAVRRELRLAQEYLADAAAAGDRPADYAAYLVHLSASPCRLPQLAAGVRAGKSDLSRRVVMLLSERAGRRASRGWRFLVGGGAVASAVALGGLTVRADEPKPKKAIEVEVRRDDDKKPAEKKPDGDKKAVEGRRLIVRAVGEDVAKLKAEIKEAAKKGDEEKVGKLVDELEKALRAAPKVFEMKMDGKPADGVQRWEVPPGGPMKFRFEAHGLDEAVKQLQAQLDSLKDASPQAREALETALAALKGQAAAGARIWRPTQPPADAFPQKPRFGAGVDKVPAETRELIDLPDGVGLLVGEVRAGTPAAAAGLKKGDILAGFGGQDVSSDPEKFVAAVRGVKAGKVEVVVVRKGKRVTLTADVGEPTKSNKEPRAEAERRAADVERRAADASKRGEEVRRKPDAGAARERKVNIRIENDTFAITAERGGPELRLKGSYADGKPTVKEVRVDDGGEKFEGKGIADVPEKYRAELTKLLGQIGGK